MYVIVTNHVNWHRKNLRSGKTQGIRKLNLSGYPVFLLTIINIHQIDLKKQQVNKYGL